MWCPEARGDCKREECVDWGKGECLRRMVLAITIEKYKQLSEIVEMQKASLSQSQEFMNQQGVLMNVLFDDIEMSDAPEPVKDYIRQYRNSETAKKLIKEIEGQ